ncbi:Dynamin-related protein DNM1 [Orchesella cincta]|uniref:Dynamin-related protein DNM1 n=1 Tax=Orchesella cincta TaxID=48709 RepID=A0A1D2MKK6_ORCCI|nr:Dynamin-related protein DNM1 [Orchesella cincta]
MRNDTWCEFFHKPNEKFDDFRKVEQEIISRTDEIAGTDFGITIGQQPDDIEEQVKNLILGYISADDAVILAVCPGNIDIANNESIKIAKTVDPTQERTIVVLTKLDLTDDYSKMTDVLNGKVVPMKLGYVGVINRSQDDLKGDKPIEEVLKHEKAFLAEKFSSISAKHGISCLAKKLNRILLQRILACCSGLSVNIRNLSTASESELRELGVDEEMTVEEKKKELFKIVDEFAKEYKAQIDGMSRSEVQSLNLTCGARIDIIINNNLPNELDALKSFENMTDTEMLVAIRNSMPVGARFINPEVALNHFIKEEIKKMAPVAIHTAQLLHQEMVNMIESCLENKRFPKANTAIYSIVSELLSSKMEQTVYHLEMYFEIQSASAFSANEGYAKFFKKVLGPIPQIDLGELPMPLVPNVGGKQGLEKSPAGFTTEQSSMFQQLKDLANQVYQMARWQAQDYIVKGILHTLIYKSIDTVAVELNTRLNESHIPENLIREPDEIHNRRTQLKSNLVEYNNALKLLDELRKASAA